MELIDSHCHLDFNDFKKDLPQVLERARAAGVVHMITIGTDPDSSAQALTLAEQHPFLSATVGHHPHDASALTAEGLKRLGSMAANSKIVGFGEIGLDFYRDLSPRPVQRKCFDDLIRLGLELSLPLIVHDREAHQEVYDFLAGAKADRGVIHCFSGDYTWAKRFLDLGFQISIPGTITYPKSKVLKDVVARVPLDRLLVETDAPFLAPEPHRGRRNEPAWVSLAAAEVARIKGLDIEEVGRITSANARSLFGLTTDGRRRS